MAKTITNSTTKAIVDYLNLNNCFVWRQNNTGVYDTRLKCFRANTNNKKGIGDVIGIKYDGTLICIEVKTAKDKQSAEQIQFQKEIEKHNGIYIIAKTFDNFLTQWKNLNK